MILVNLEAGSTDAADMPRLLPPAERTSGGQLSLFEDPAAKIAKKLREVDMDSTTPLEAFNMLKEMLEMLD